MSSRNVLYPEYKIDHDEEKFAIRTLKKRLMKELKKLISEIVANGIIDIPQVWSLLHQYVLCMTCAKTTHPTPMTELSTGQ